MRYATEQIIHKLREIEVVVAQGISIKQACRQSSIADNTYYKWRNGGLNLFAMGRETAACESIRRFSERPRRETSEPSEATESGQSCS